MNFSNNPQDSYYMTTGDNSENKQIYMDHFGWDKCGTKRQFYCYRNIYLLHYVLKGGGTLNINSQNHQLRAGDIFLIRPNQPAVYSPNDVDPWEYYFFAFNGPMAESLIENTVFNHNNSVYTIKNDAIAETIFNMKDGFDNAISKEFYTLEKLFHLLQLLAHDEQVNVQDSTEDMNEVRTSAYYTERVTKYIHTNYNTPITVNAIAKELNINRSLLYSYFKKETGMDIITYMINIRMQHAREWLSMTSIPSNTIADMVGYNNYTSFQRAFTQKVGMTPGQYRKATQKSTVRNKAP